MLRVSDALQKDRHHKLVSQHQQRPLSLVSPDVTRPTRAASTLGNDPSSPPCYNSSRQGARRSLKSPLTEATYPTSSADCGRLLVSENSCDFASPEFQVEVRTDNNRVSVTTPAGIELSISTSALSVHAFAEAVGMQDNSEAEKLKMLPLKVGVSERSASVSATGKVRPGSDKGRAPNILISLSKGVPSVGRIEQDRTLITEVPINDLDNHTRLANGSMRTATAPVLSTVNSETQVQTPPEERAQQRSNEAKDKHVGMVVNPNPDGLDAGPDTLKEQTTPEQICPLAETTATPTDIVLDPQHAIIDTAAGKPEKEIHPGVTKATKPVDENFVNPQAARMDSVAEAAKSRVMLPLQSSNPPKLDEKTLTTSRPISTIGESESAPRLEVIPQISIAEASVPRSDLADLNPSSVLKRVKTSDEGKGSTVHTAATQSLPAKNPIFLNIIAPSSTDRLHTVATTEALSPLQTVKVDALTNGTAPESATVQAQSKAEPPPSSTTKMIVRKVRSIVWRRPILVALLGRDVALPAYAQLQLLGNADSSMAK